MIKEDYKLVEMNRLSFYLKTNKVYVHYNMQWFYIHYSHKRELKPITKAIRQRRIKDINDVFFYCRQGGAQLTSTVSRP